MTVCTEKYVSGSERPLKEEASDEDEDTEFFDAMEDSPAFITVTTTENTQHRSVHSLSLSVLLYSVYLCTAFAVCGLNLPRIFTVDSDHIWW